MANVIFVVEILKQMHQNLTLIIIFVRRSAQVSDCGKYLFLNIVKDCRDNLVYFADLEEAGDIKTKLKITPIVTKFESDYEVSYRQI